jgi:hypothetical protein
LADKVERWLEGVRENRGLSVPVNMHIKHARVLEEEMVMKGRDFDTVFQQGRHNGIDFFLCEYEIAHQNFHSTVTLGQGDPTTETEWGRRLMAGDSELQMVARNIYFEHFGFEVAGAAEEGQDIRVFLGHILGEERSSER